MPALFGAAGGGGGVPAPGGGMAAIGPLLPRQPPRSPETPGPGAGWSSPGPGDDRFNTTYYNPGAPVPGASPDAQRRAAAKSRRQMQRATKQFGGATPDQYRQDFWHRTDEGGPGAPSGIAGWAPNDPLPFQHSGARRPASTYPRQTDPAKFLRLPLGLGGR